MIYEDYVSFETAKLLKEKWFDVDECEVHYDPLDHTQYEITHQMAMKWLREEKGIYIVFFHTNKSGWWYNITDMRDSYVFYSSEKIMCSYEEVVDAALKYTLENLI